ncbi:hypothetical protein ACFL4V_00100 [Candidatus Latescibacterota bacterium]
MNRLWMRIRLPLAILVLLVITLAMARLFSGPEDTWIKNDRGEWVKHGYPSGPPPPEDYREPVYHLVIPLIFLFTFAVPLFFLGKHKPHNRLNFDTAVRDIRFFGYLSTALFLFGILAIAGLTIEILLADNGNLQSLEFFIISSVEGFAGLCILLGVLFFVLKRNCNDHYQLMKSHHEIMELLENNKR